LQFVAAEHLARGIVRRVDDDGARPIVERTLQLIRIEPPVGRAQPHIARLGSGKNRIRPIVFVKRLKDDDFVARVEAGHHHRHHGFGGSAADGDLLVGNHRHAEAAREVLGDGVAKRGGAIRRRVLVLLGLDRRASRVLDSLRRFEIREALREIDGVVQLGQPRHFAEHGIGKRRHPARTSNSAHGRERF
jgi:hypothetical protein